MSSYDGDIYVQNISTATFWTVKTTRMQSKCHQHHPVWYHSVVELSLAYSGESNKQCSSLQSTYATLQAVHEPLNSQDCRTSPCTRHTQDGATATGMTRVIRKTNCLREVSISGGHHITYAPDSSLWVPHFVFVSAIFNILQGVAFTQLTSVNIILFTKKNCFNRNHPITQVTKQ